MMVKCFVAIALILSAQIASISAAPTVGERIDLEDLDDEPLDDVDEKLDDDDVIDDADDTYDTYLKDTYLSDGLATDPINYDSVPAIEDPEFLEAAIKQLLQESDKPDQMNADLQDLIDALPMNNPFRAELVNAEEMLEAEVESSSNSIPPPEEITPETPSTVI